MQDYEGTILDGRDTSENRIKKKNPCPHRVCILSGRRKTIKTINILILWYGRGEKLP